MCYPCRNCGSCTNDKELKVMKCPNCETAIQNTNRPCPVCGWLPPLPPGFVLEKTLESS